jgi:hypothetical protein
MCYFAHAVTSHVASAPRLAEDVAAFVPVSLPARARKALLASDQSQIERTPFFWRHYVRPFTISFKQPTSGRLRWTMADARTRRGLFGWATER